MDGLLDRSVLYGDPAADYGLLDAFLISAGAAASAAKNQAMRKGMSAAELLSGLVGNASWEEWAALERAEAERRLAEEARLYEPMRQAFPYVSAIGETLPASVLGLRGMGGQMNFNLGRAALEQTAPDGSLFSRLARGLRPY